MLFDDFVETSELSGFWGVAVFQASRSFGLLSRVNVAFFNRPVRDCIRFPLETAPHSRSPQFIQYTPLMSVHHCWVLLSLKFRDFKRDTYLPRGIKVIMYDKSSRFAPFFVFLSGCLMFPWQCTSSSDAPVWQEHQDVACKKKKGESGHLLTDTSLPVSGQETSLCMV